MRAFLSPLTAFAILVHTVLGCCWHHEHPHTAAAGTSAGNALAAAEEHRGCCGGHDEKAPSESEGEDHDGDGPHDSPRPCQEVDCDFPFVEQPPRSEVVPCCWLLAPGDAQIAAAEQAATACRDGGASPPCAAPPVRPHLLLEILLI